MAYCISKRILISWIIILGGISNSAQSACVTRPQVTLNGNNNPSTSIRLHWQWFTTSIGCVQADDIRIQYALTNRDQCQQLNPQPTPVAVSGPNQFVLIDNLEPYSTYTITYELYLGFGRAAHDDIHVLTGPDIPAPASISVSTFDSHFVLSWTPVDCSAVAVCSSVTGYKFKLVSADGTDARMGEVHSGLKVTLTGLPCIEYTFQVNAITDAGIGTMSSRIKATLSALTEPTNLRTPNADADSITIEWEPPISQGTCTDTKITGYRIEISQGLSKQNVSVSVASYSHEFRNLKGNQIYTIRMKTIGEAGHESPWSKAISAYTNEGVSGKPQNVRATKVTSSSITIEWNTPRYPNGDITYYDVRLTQKYQLDTSTTSMIRHTNLDSLKINFPDLLPNTTYIFSIRANKDDDSLIGEEETLVVTTGIDGVSLSPWALYIGVAVGSIVVLTIVVCIIVRRRRFREILVIYGILKPRPVKRTESVIPIVDNHRQSRRQSEYRVPIEWMAFETLDTLKFSTQTDVWAFGILLWEIFTWGEMPYSGQGPRFESQAIRTFLQDENNRLEKPENCDDNMYGLMRHCWSQIPGHRPSFTQIVGKLEEMI